MFRRDVASARLHAAEHLLLLLGEGLGVLLLVLLLGGGLLGALLGLHSLLVTTRLLTPEIRLTAAQRTSADTDCRARSDVGPGGVRTRLLVALFLCPACELEFVEDFLKLLKERILLAGQRDGRAVMDQERRVQDAENLTARHARQSCPGSSSPRPRRPDEARPRTQSLHFLHQSADMHPCDSATFRALSAGTKLLRVTLSRSTHRRLLRRRIILLLLILRRDCSPLLQRETQARVMMGTLCPRLHRNE